MSLHIFFLPEGVLAFVSVPPRKMNRSPAPHGVSLMAHLPGAALMSSSQGRTELLPCLLPPPPVFLK